MCHATQPVFWRFVAWGSVFKKPRRRRWRGKTQAAGTKRLARPSWWTIVDVRSSHRLRTRHHLLKWLVQWVPCRLETCKNLPSKQDSLFSIFFHWVSHQRKYCIYNVRYKPQRHFQIWILEPSAKSSPSMTKQYVGFACIPKRSHDSTWRKLGGWDEKHTCQMDGWNTAYQLTGIKKELPKIQIGNTCFFVLASWHKMFFTLQKHVLPPSRGCGTWYTK